MPVLQIAPLESAGKDKETKRVNKCPVIKENDSTRDT